MLARTLGQAVGQVCREMRDQKLRFALNVTAFVIGGACLIVLAALVDSAALLISSEASETTAAARLTVTPSAPPPSQQRRTRRPLDSGDALALAGAGPLVQGTVTSEREATVEVRFGQQRRQVKLTGSGVDLVHSQGLSLAHGRFFSAVEERSAAAVAVVGAKLGRDLLSGARAGQPVPLRIGARRFVVIGVLQSKPGMGDDGPWAWDERVIVPWTSFRHSFQTAGSDRQVSRITWRATGQPGQPGDVQQALVHRARTVMSAVLRTRHFDVQNFRLQDPGNQDQSRLLGWIVGALLLFTAVVSFLVGGFTITNASLASVAERRSEIGIKRAIGASRGTIVLQFLLETMIGALLGGLLSVAAGAGLAWMTAVVIGVFVADWQVVVPTWALLAAAGLALVVGMLSGIYPAWRAARLDPIEALRAD